MYYTVYFQTKNIRTTLIGQNRLEVADIINRFISSQNISVNPVTANMMTMWISKKKKSPKYHFVSVNKFLYSKSKSRHVPSYSTKYLTTTNTRYSC